VAKELCLRMEPLRLCLVDFSSLLDLTFFYFFFFGDLTVLSA
jgi:hypothetical protein